MSYSGKGNQNELLKINSSNQHKFQEISLPTTVASGSVYGADYTSLAAAISDSKTFIKIIGDTFETQDVVTGNSIIIEIENASLLDLGLQTYDGVGVVDIRGNGRVRYAKGDLFQPVFKLRLNIDGLDVINSSTQIAPLTFGTDSRITNSRFIGSCVIAGSGTMLNACNISGDLIILAGSSGCNIQQSQVKNGLAIDSGNKTVFTNIKFN